MSNVTENVPVFNKESFVQFSDVNDVISIGRSEDVPISSFSVVFHFNR
jgi:hypothetical protein